MWIGKPLHAIVAYALENATVRQLGYETCGRSHFEPRMASVGRGPAFAVIIMQSQWGTAAGASPRPTLSPIDAFMLWNSITDFIERAYIPLAYHICINALERCYASTACFGED